MREHKKEYSLIFFISIIMFLTSCSSSSYYERYSSYDSAPKPKIQNSQIEDEETELPGKVPNYESNYVLEKLSLETDESIKKEKFLKEILSYINTPYRYGGTTKNGIDCSAFTQNVYKSLNVELPRTAREQYRNWEIFNNKSDLKFGDLIYFDTSSRNFPGHVGIYLDDNLFAHASTSSGVVISSLEDDYYSKKFVGANRVKIKITNNY